MNLIEMSVNGTQWKPLLLNYKNELYFKPFTFQKNHTLPI